MIEPISLSRRGLLLGACAGLVAGCSSPGEIASTPADQVPAHGEHQAGIVTPADVQRHCGVFVWDAPGPAEVAAALRRLSTAVPTLATGNTPALAGMAPAALTVTVGIGPRIVAAVDPSLPGAVDLPAFAREQIAPTDRGGDLLLQVCAADPLSVNLAGAALAGALGAGFVPRWRQTGVRGDPAVDTAAPRNPLGFADGIINPAPEDYGRTVWLDEPSGRVAGGTIAVVRRFSLDTSRFLALPVGDQEQVIGRRRASSVPLSGGAAVDGPDLGAKTADGRYLVPVDAHIRRAHPNVTGAELMLRRSYSVSDASGLGLLFICFQRDLNSFVRTQQALDERDSLLDYATVTASGTFLILPGFTPSRPLGAPLFAGVRS
jgi:dye decolorizing peroxidase